jgi:hypothetical protein
MLRHKAKNQWLANALHYWLRKNVIDIDEYYRLMAVICEQVTGASE